MNSAPDDFNDVRRLLSLKRHEQPPPGYFQSFSAKVIARIEAAEVAAAAMPWWRRVLAGLEAGPALAFSVAVIGGVALLAGLSSAPEPGGTTALAPANEPLLAVKPSSSLLALPDLASLPEIASNATAHPVAAPSEGFAPASLFDIRLPQPVQPASLGPGGR
jgi:hypothetical protein